MWRRFEHKGKIVPVLDSRYEQACSGAADGSLGPNSNANPDTAGDEGECDQNDNPPGRIREEPGHTVNHGINRGRPPCSRSASGSFRLGFREPRLQIFTLSLGRFNSPLGGPGITLCLLCCFRQEVSVNVGLAPFFRGLAESFTSFVVDVLTLSRWLGYECEGENGTKEEYPVVRRELTWHELFSKLEANPQGEPIGKWDAHFLPGNSQPKILPKLKRRPSTKVF
jgi:hypothetical protein